jgi:hypothetical protein
MTDENPTTHGQYDNHLGKPSFSQSPTGRRYGMWDKNRARPFTLAVIDSKIRFRSLARSSNAPIDNAPMAAPAASDTATIVGMPRFLRLTHPIMAPT